MPRTTPEAVGEIISLNPRLPLAGFISAANVLVDKLSAADTEGVLNTQDLAEIEKWLTAHFYSHRDQLLQSKSMGGASGSFQGQTAMHLNSTQYGQTAMLLDVTGWLTRRSLECEQGKASAGAIWLGTQQSVIDSGEAAGWA